MRPDPHGGRQATGRFDPQAAAQRLLASRRGGATVDWHDILPPDLESVYAVQAATVSALGGAKGWKVGAQGLRAQPIFAPLPGSGLFDDGVVLSGPSWRLRGVELELGFRLGRDVDIGADAHTDRVVDQVADAIDAVLPVIEVVETRLAGWEQSDRWAKLADLQSHGALVVGAPSAVLPSAVNLTELRAELWFDDVPVAATVGGNPALDVWRLLGELARHASRRGTPLRAGQVLTTGSCTGMLFASPGCRVRGQLGGIGTVGLRF